ncbi:histidine kinase [Azoarcus sp. L1K30]|uniref:ATP-binding protein n=1 Tax=Azoarcus sp. L1K30 TaxID=2820277 RepID=UPI001B83ED5E|nr:ATP-binding protein [Azoarcus sp. L1K30]MBR0567724.1 histidine kinase [Azoarcus sp. L1K30]
MPNKTNAALHAEIARLNKMLRALMDRAERTLNSPGSQFGLFQSNLLLERQVQERTRALAAALEENERVTRALTRTKDQLQREKEEQQRLILELEQADIQVRQSERLASIGLLAAGLAHEINNPIGFVNSNLGTLNDYAQSLLNLVDAYEALEPEIPPSERKEKLRELRRTTDLAYLRQDVMALISESLEGASRVQHIVHDLRDFSRAGHLARRRVDLHVGLERAISLVSNELKLKADVVREYGDVPLVDCIPSQIDQVFMNLLLNAVHAIPKHGTILLRSGRQSDLVWISISDDGIGIPAENLSKVFDPFFTTKDVGKGTGLGLSVSYGIVHKHGGRIELTSEAGVGTTFVVWLPITQASAQPDESLTDVTPGRQ